MKNVFKYYFFVIFLLGVSQPVLSYATFTLQNNSTNDVEVLGANFFSRTVKANKSNWYWVGTSAEDITTLRFTGANGEKHTLDIEDVHDNSCADKYWFFYTKGWAMKLTLDGKEIAQRVCFTFDGNRPNDGWNVLGKVTITDTNITVATDGTYRSYIHPGFASVTRSIPSTHCLRKRGTSSASGCKWASYPMLEKYKGEESAQHIENNFSVPVSAKYLNESERKQYELKVCYDGEFVCDAKGNPFESKSSLSGISSKIKLTGVTLEAPYVMSPSGKIYAMTQKEAYKFVNGNNKVMYHSAFLAGDKVAAAGKIVVSGGEIVSIDNNSGHYQPPFSSVQQVIDQLASSGYQDTDNISSKKHPGSIIKRDLGNSNLLKDCSADDSACEIASYVSTQMNCQEDAHVGYYRTLQDLSTVPLSTAEPINLDAGNLIVGMRLTARLNLNIPANSSVDLRYGTTAQAATGNYVRNCVADNGYGDDSAASGSFLFKNDSISVRKAAQTVTSSNTSSDSIKQPHELIMDYQVNPVTGVGYQRVELWRTDKNGQRINVLSGRDTIETINAPNILTGNYWANRFFNLSTHFSGPGSVTFNNVSLKTYKGSRQPMPLTIDSQISPYKTYKALISSQASGRKCSLQWTGGNPVRHERNAKWDCSDRGDAMGLKINSITLVGGEKRLTATIVAADSRGGALQWDANIDGNNERNAKFDTQDAADPVVIHLRKNANSSTITTKAHNNTTCGLQWQGGNIPADGERNAKWDCSPSTDNLLIELLPQ